jgi:hypothetical protein
MAHLRSGVLRRQPGDRRVTSVGREAGSDLSETADPITGAVQNSYTRVSRRVGAFARTGGSADLRRSKSVPPAAYLVGSVGLSGASAQSNKEFRESATSSKDVLALDHLRIRWTYVGHNGFGA